MKVIYLISMGHSGSTLIDCILGTHPDFQSCGELRYLNWQLERTLNGKTSADGQDLCCCGEGFRDCSFWSQVFLELQDLTGLDIDQKPRSFNTSYFGRFSYSGDKTFPLLDFSRKAGEKITRKMLERGIPKNLVYLLNSGVREQLHNNHLLYEIISTVSKKEYLVDSSKDLLSGLLMQKEYPNDIVLLFVHRKIEGLVSSAKRWSKKTGRPYSLATVIKSKQNFDQRVKRCKAIPNLSYFETTYEDVAGRPASFLDQLVEKVGAGPNFVDHENEAFFIDPTKLHLVAGNPMRYKGRQLVKYDERWRTELKEQELHDISRLYYGS